MSLTDETELQKTEHQLTPDKSEPCLGHPHIESSLEDLSPMVSPISVSFFGQRTNYVQVDHLLDPYNQYVYLLVRRQEPLRDIHLLWWLYASQVPRDNADTYLIPTLEHSGLSFLLHQLKDRVL